MGRAPAYKLESCIKVTVRDESDKDTPIGITRFLRITPPESICSLMRTSLKAKKIHLCSIFCVCNLSVLDILPELRMGSKQTFVLNRGSQT
jgi:hypothetical protein